MRLLKWIGGVTGLALIAGLAIGVLAGVPIADGVDRYFSSDEFCSTACHTMTETVAKELKDSTHWTTPTGVRAGCKDCHVSEGLAAAYWDHIIGLGELYATYVEGVRTVEAFEERRAAAADRVRMDMLANDSKYCRTCHVMEAIRPERVRGQRQHEEAKVQGITCIVCHYNLVHKDVPPSEAFDKAIAAY